MSQERTQESMTVEAEEEINEETFLKELYAYMKNRDTPIERIPHLGFKQIDLFVMFKTVQSLGGYNQVTAHQLWKQVYNKLGGNPRSTSAATCTRRHYEKLILPYECYLRGEDNKGLTLPRQQKRSRCSTFPHGEEDLRGGKRSTIYGHMQSMLQNSHDFLDDRVRVIPMPLQLQHYFNSSSTALPPYLPSAPIMSTPPHHPDSRAYYLAPPLEVSERPKQHLVVLRTLANEYISSSGWAEPLNLSCKEGGICEVSQQPSSFTPTGSNKMPKFLNKVVPLYQACDIAKADGPQVLDTKVGKAKPSSAGPCIRPFPAPKSHIIELTNPAGSQPSLPVTDPTIKTEAFITAPLWHHGPASPDPPIKIPETEIQSKKEGEAPKPSQSPLNLSCSMTSPSHDSSGRMEIQIPLALLQDWFKGSFASGLRNRVSAMGLQSDESQIKGGEARPQMQVNSETPLGMDKPSDLSFREYQSHSDSSLKGEARNFTGFVTQERHTRNEDHYTSISRHHHPLSPGIMAGEWEPKTGCREGFAPYHPDMFSKGSTGRSPHRFCLQNKEYVAHMSSPKGLFEKKDLVVGRNSSQVQFASLKSPLDPHEQEQGNTGPLSLTYKPETCQSASSAALLGPWEKARSISGPSDIFLVNSTSSSLQPLTQEEYLKLRRLISSSQ